MSDIVTIGDCTLYHADCMDVLPTLPKVDAVVTDPPYGTQELGGGYGRRQLHSENGRDGRTILGDHDLSTFKSAVELMASYNCYILAFYAPRKTRQFIEAIGDIEYVGEIVWDKKQMGLGYTVRYSHESIAVLKVGNPEKPLFAIDSVITAHQMEKSHPHQKPIELMKTLCSWQQGNVLDPFMGSGTTGVACVNLGRKFIGIEKERKYFDIACERIQRATNQGKLWP